MVAGILRRAARQSKSVQFTALLRHITQCQGRGRLGALPPLGGTTLAKDIPKSAEVFTIRATETVKGAAEQMRQHGVSALVVKGNEAIKGMISDRDIVYTVSWLGAAAISLAVSAVMSHAVVTVAPATASSAPWA
jgi:predicted transcriptional regulator